MACTATVYLKRTFVRHSFVELDPRPLAPACLYLACKAEESQVQAKLIVAYAKQAQGGHPWVKLTQVRLR